MAERRIEDSLDALTQDVHSLSLALGQSSHISSRYRRAIQELHLQAHGDQSLWFEKCNKTPCKNLF